ncbi:tail fiber domain-containing protein [candidate division KSB1 bacterium]|nr:tail fiber domain-containing protein [candidate division KSB1 bacterium]
MPFTPDPPYPKGQGDVLRSDDWNDAIEEIKRLDAAKVNKAGDEMTGPLKITNQGPGEVLLDLNSERNWQFKQFDTGANSTLELVSVGGGGNKNFVINTGGRIGIGTSTPSAKLHITGGVDASLTGDGFLLIGDKAGTNIVLDDNEIMARNNGANSTLYVQAEGGDFNIGGNARLSHADTFLDFGSDVRQMINLWGGGPDANYGIGVQGYTQYYRSDGNFAWYIGGTHEDNELSAGTGGKLAMVIRRPDGNVGIGTTNPSHKFHVIANDAVGLFESSGGQAYLRLSTNEGIGNRVEITNRPGGRLSLWTAGAGDAFNILRNGNVGIGITNPTENLTVNGTVRLGSGGQQVFIGGNLTGPFMRLNDDLWFSDPQNGSIWIRNYNNSNWGTLVGKFNNMSSYSHKKDVTVLKESDFEQLLHDTLKTDLVRFRFIEDEETHRLSLGVISEESPSYIVGDDGESISTSEYVSMLHGAIKALANKKATQEEYLTIDRDSGKISIGKAGAGVSFEIYGNAIKAGGGSWTSFADKRLKKNVKALKGALDRVTQLRGVTFEWKAPEKQGNLTGTQIGLVAQEVEKVFPEWVDENPEGYKNLTMRGFEALSVEAFKELNDTNTKLQEKIKNLESRIKNLEKQKAGE